MCYYVLAAGWDQRGLLRHYSAGPLPLLMVWSGHNAAWCHWWPARGSEWGKTRNKEVAEEKACETRITPMQTLISHLRLLSAGVLDGDSTSAAHKQTAPSCADFCLLWWVSEHPWKVLRTHTAVCVAAGGRRAERAPLMLQYTLWINRASQLTQNCLIGCVMMWQLWTGYYVL